MAEKTVNVVYEGNRKKLALDGKDFLTIEKDIQALFQLTDIEIVAKQKGGTECDLWDDSDLVSLPTTTEIFVYEVLKNPLAISFGTEEHALDVIPPSHTVLVKVAVDVVMKDFDVPNYVGKLGEFVEYVRHANYYLIAAGELKLNIQLLTFGRDTLQPVLNNGKTTLDDYVRTSRDIMEKLQAVFEYCRDGLDKSAMINLEHLAMLSSKMKDQSSERGVELSEAMTTAKDLLVRIETTYAETGSKEKTKWTTLKDGKDRLKELGDEVKEKQAAYHEVKKVREEFDEVDRALHPLTKLYWTILYAFHITPNDRGGLNYEDWQKKKQAMEKADTRKSGDFIKVYGAMVKESELKDEVGEFEKDHGETSGLATCLNKAVGSMRRAHVTMQKMSMFWEYMKIALEQLAGDQPFVDCIRNATSGNKREAKKLWRSRGFKMQSISYMARCVAIRDISTACSKGMSRVGKDIDVFLTETPTREEAEKWLAALSQRGEERINWEGTIFEQSSEVNLDVEREARKCFNLSSSFVGPSPCACPGLVVSPTSTMVGVEECGGHGLASLEDQRACLKAMNIEKN